ncbi:MAG TPA: hypothetical protein VGN97_11610 [Mesorhizobium sp.]|jgi:hypothetical protein|nr:hypothetical protein [Mesorhizobium sp.]
MPQPHEQNDEPKQQQDDKASMPSGVTANQVPSDVIEDLKNRRTAGRSENPDLLEEELQQGLEESFPASDPPAVTSNTIAGGSKIKGVDETLREQREGRKE